MEAPADAAWFEHAVDDEAVEHLFVGRLTSRAFDVATGRNVFGSGPVDGKVLASWMGGDGTSQLVLVDTKTGTTTPVHQRDRWLLPLLSPDGRTAYWLEQTEEQVEGVFRLALDGDEVQRVADGWPGFVYSAEWATDGEHIVFAGLAETQPEWAQGLYEYRILDVTDGTLEGPLDFMGQEVAGLHGDDLIAYAVDPGTGQGHLVSVDLATGDTADLTPGWNEVDAEAGRLQGWNQIAAVVEDVGTPVLIVDGAQDDHYAIFRMALDGSDRRLLWESDTPWDRSSTSMVRSAALGGAETPGWIVIAPSSEPYPWPSEDDRGDRLLVSIADGTVVELPPIPELEQPATAPSSSNPAP